MAALRPDSVRPASLSSWLARDLLISMPMSMASTETYSSPSDLEKSMAFCRASLLSRESITSPPETLGSMEISLSMACFRIGCPAPSFWNMKLQMVSFSCSNALRICSGSICCWPEAFVSSMAFCMASWLLMVKLLKFILVVVFFSIMQF